LTIVHTTLAAAFVLNHTRIGNGAINKYGTNLQLRDDFVYIRMVLNRKRRNEYCAPLKKEHLAGDGGFGLQLAIAFIIAYECTKRHWQTLMSSHRMKGGQILLTNSAPLSFGQIYLDGQSL
jgi:hypothetical protein